MNLRTRVKICGLTRPDDALAAVSLGVDALGLVFYEKSPRFVEIEQAAEICNEVPAFVTTVALFMDASNQMINEVLSRVKIDLLQFHGSEKPDFCNRFGRPYIKALGAGDGGSEALVEQCGRYADARGVLVDSHAPGEAGGTGQVFDWGRVPALDKPVILAGGLTVDNVAEAIRQARPYAVDVSSGVERDKGLKSADLMSAFVQEVYNANGLFNAKD